MRAADLGGRAPDAATAHAVEAVDKRFANARARLAMAGFQLHAIDCGPGRSEYLVQRWDRSRVLKDLEAVERFIAQALGPAK